MSEAGAGAPATGAPASRRGEPVLDEPAGEPVIVLADDLVWATRLVGQLETLGARPVRCRTADAFEAALAAGTARRSIVDLTARAYDGVAATGRAAAGGLRVICVGQHDDGALRAAARAAGAERVYAYRALFEGGHAALAAWLGVPVPAPGSRDVPPSAGRVEGPSA